MPCHRGRANNLALYLAMLKSLAMITLSATCCSLLRTCFTTC